MMNIPEEQALKAVYDEFPFVEEIIKKLKQDKGHLIDMPENMPLYKDSGLWQLRSDNMEDVVIQQGVNEPNNDFIKRCQEIYFNTTNK